jgi:penicillin-binding protein 1A
MGVFVGYDNPQPMGHGETGGELAAPVFAEFMKQALKDKPAIPFRTPPDIRRVVVNKRTGQRTDPSDPEAIDEYFKPGTEPAEGYATAGYPGEEAPPPPAPGNGWGASSSSTAGAWGPQGGRAQQDYPPGGGYQSPYGRQPAPGGLY